MGWDISKWAVDNFLNDFAETPITIQIKDLSENYDIKITVQAFKKEG